jgi:hypothetical protein
MDAGIGHVRGACYGEDMGEAHANSVTASERPRGCCRIDTSEPIHMTTVAATLVAAVAGARPRGAPPSHPDRTTEAWLELERRLVLVTRAAATLGSRIPRLRDPRFARQIAHGVDNLLHNIAAGCGALELAIGDGLHALETGRRAMDLGYSNVGDYAREELGLNASTAAKKARLARKLRDRPLVREALRRGEITPRKAEIIVPVAVGDKQMLWILRAKAETVRGLRKAVRAKPDSADEEWHRLTAAVAPEQRPILDEGLRWGGIVLGARSKKMERVEAWGQEYLSAHRVPEGRDVADDVFLSSDADADALAERLERESRQWKDLATADPLKAPEFSGEIDPWRIDAELKGFMEMRNCWDDAFGHVALLLKQYRAWEILQFASFRQYCEERLGMAPRTVGQRVALERSLLRIPLLRQALKETRITYEKARVIARHFQDGHALELRPLIAMAETLTCVELRERLEVEAEEQMCARGLFTVTMPPHVIDLLKDTFRAVRAEAKRWISIGQCLLRTAAHFADVWRVHLKEIKTARGRILARDLHRCQVPGCSRPAEHLHHIEFRAHGGSNDPANLIGLCAAHHLFGIHEERMNVSGKAPDKLLWKFGLRRSWAHTAVP